MDGIDETEGTVDKQKKNGPWTNPRGTQRDQRGEEEIIGRKEKRVQCFRSKESASRKKK